jgi:hypothetical protein
MKRTSIVMILIGVCLTLAIGTPSVATAVLDQQNVINTSGDWTYDELFHLGSNPDTFNQFAQIFTVGVAGTLSIVEVEAYHSFATHGPMLVDIWNTNAGLPDPSVSLAHWFIDDTNSSMTAGTFVSLDLGSEAFAVSPGEIYAIVFSSNNSTYQGGRLLVRGTSDTYAGGDSFSRRIYSDYTSATSWDSNGSDYGFRTFVDIQNVPEPSTMLLLCSGLLGILGFKREFLK